jgi:hypothetical protein
LYISRFRAWSQVVFGSQTRNPISAPRVWIRRPCVPARVGADPTTWARSAGTRVVSNDGGARSRSRANPAASASRGATERNRSAPPASGGPSRSITASTRSRTPVPQATKREFGLGSSPLWGSAGLRLTHCLALSQLHQGPPRPDPAPREDLRRSWHPHPPTKPRRGRRCGRICWSTRPVSVVSTDPRTTARE